MSDQNALDDKSAVAYSYDNNIVEIHKSDEARNDTVSQKRKDHRFWRKWCRHGCGFWCKKYFWEGQLKAGAVDDGYEETVPGPFSGLSTFQRKLVGILIPACFFHFWYWSVMSYNNLYYVFIDKYPLAVTMIIGSILAGMTTVGGGAVAFPVMTLVMKETPDIGRDLSMSLQANGMSAASFSIFFMGVHIERHALLYSLIGSSIGVILGLEFVDEIVPNDVKNMVFASVFFAFAFTLYLINRDITRKTFNNILYLNWWKRLLLFIFGIIGGIFTSFTGSGADICMFSLLTLFFKVSEKVATPTSVVLMAATSFVCLMWKWLVTNSMPVVSWEYLLCVLPFVTLGAPFGALIGTHFHRLVLAACVYILTTISLISAFAIIPQTPALACSSVATIVVMFALFYVIYRMGDAIFDKEHERYVSKSKKQQLGNISNDDFVTSNGDVNI